MTLRLGIVGCGSIARAHAVSFRFLADDGVARLVAAADPNPAGIDRVEQIAGPLERRYADGLDLIADPEVDAVAVVAPTRFHRDLIAAVAAAGKPLFTIVDHSTVWAMLQVPEAELARVKTSLAQPARLGF